MIFQSKKGSDIRIITVVTTLVITAFITSGAVQASSFFFKDALQEQIAQLTVFETASLAFKEKYKSIPGDMSVDNALQFNFTTPGSKTGGNGKLEDAEGLIPNYYAYGENSAYFVNIVDAKLLKDYMLYNKPHEYKAGVTYPKSPFGGGITAIGHTDGVYYFIGPLEQAVSNVQETIVQNNPEPTLKPVDAYNLDVKLDDGKPIDGNVRAVKLDTNIQDNFLRDRTLNNCVGADLQTYNVTSEKLACRIIIKSKVD